MSSDIQKPMFAVTRAPLITNYEQWQNHYDYAMDKHKDIYYSRMYATYQCLADQGQLRIRRSFGPRWDSWTSDTTIYDIEEKYRHEHMTSGNRCDEEEGDITPIYTKYIYSTEKPSTTLEIVIIVQLDHDPPDFNEFCDETGTLLYNIIMESLNNLSRHTTHKGRCKYLDCYQYPIIITIDKKYVEDQFE